MTETILLLCGLGVIFCNVGVLVLATANAKARVVQVGSRKSVIPVTRGSLVDRRV